MTKFKRDECIAFMVHLSKERINMGNLQLCKVIGHLCLDLKSSCWK